MVTPLRSIAKAGIAWLALSSVSKNPNLVRAVQPGWKLGEEGYVPEISANIIEKSWESGVEGGTLIVLEKNGNAVRQAMVAFGEALDNYPRLLQKYMDRVTDSLKSCIEIIGDSDEAFQAAISIAVEKYTLISMAYKKNPWTPNDFYNTASECLSELEKTPLGDKKFKEFASKYRKQLNMIGEGYYSSFHDQNKLREALYYIDIPQIKKGQINFDQAGRTCKGVKKDIMPLAVPVVPNDETLNCLGAATGVGKAISYLGKHTEDGIIKFLEEIGYSKIEYDPKKDIFQQIHKDRKKHLLMVFENLKEGETVHALQIVPYMDGHAFVSKGGLLTESRFPTLEYFIELYGKSAGLQISLYKLTDSATQQYVKLRQEYGHISSRQPSGEL